MRLLNQKTSLLLFVLLLTWIPPFSRAADFKGAWANVAFASETFTGKVVGVSDGDTISVMREGKAVKVRLHGIDCPEKKQPYGTKAKRFTSDMAFGKEVTIWGKTKDRYGRIVGEVILPDGKNLNREIVDAGLAWWYQKYAPNDWILKALEAGARAKKRGLWMDKNPIPPWEWRKNQYGYEGNELGVKYLQLHDE